MEIKSLLLKHSLFLSLPAVCFFAVSEASAQVAIVPPQIKIECKNTFINRDDALPADVFEAASEEIGGRCDVLVQLESFDRKKVGYYTLSCEPTADGSCIAFEGTVGKMVRDYNATIAPRSNSNKLISVVVVKQPRLNPKQTELINIIPGFSSVRYIDYISNSLTEHCAGPDGFPGGPSYESISSTGLIDSQQVMTIGYPIYRNFETTAFVTNEISLGCRPRFVSN